MTVAAFAADNSFFVIKDKKGVYKVIKGKENTPATIAGPFNTKSEVRPRKRNVLSPLANLENPKPLPNPVSSGSVTVS